MESIKFQLNSKAVNKRKRLDEDINVGRGKKFEIDKIDESEPKIVSYTKPHTFNPLEIAKEQKQELVIPLIQSFNNSNKSTDELKTSEDLDAQAANEIMKELTTGEATKNEDDLVISGPSVNSNNNVSSKKQPLLLAGLASELLGVVNDEERFRRDMELRADDMDFRSEKYKSVPIAEFGAALLRGMGWTGPTDEDKERLKKLDQPMNTRDGRLGLGAMPKPPEDKRSDAKNKKKNKEEWNKKVDETIKKQSLKIFDLVWIRNPQEVGNRAQVVMVKGVPGLDRIRVRMETDGRVIDFHKLDLVLLTEDMLETEPYLKTFKDISLEPVAPQFKGLEADKSIAAKSSIDREHQGKSSNKQSNHEKTSSEYSQRSNSWLTTSIRVRIISKKFKNGSYLQKGVVEDIYSGGLASIKLDDGSFIDSVKEKHLETVLPSCGGTCKVLRGEYKGQLAKLLEKKREIDVAVIQLVEDYDVIQLPMDDIAAII